MSEVEGSSARRGLASVAPEVRRAAILGLVVNLALAALKLVVGFLARSQAVVADGVHSVSDLLTDAALIVGVRYWSAPADDGHPHGHGRIETVVTLAIGGVLALVGIAIGVEAVATLRDDRLGTPAPPALAATLASIVAKEWLYRWTAARGRALHSSALLANAWHHRSDALSSIPAAAAVTITLLGPSLAYVDRVGALVVCALILVAAYRIVRPALAQLVDVAAPAAERRRIEALAVAVDGVRAAHALRTRYVGTELAVDLHLEVDGRMSVIEGYEIAKAVRRTLLELGPGVTDVVVQVEPHAPP